MTVVERTTVLPYPPEEVYAWHSRPGALERLTPPWEPVTVTSREGTIESGRVTLRLSLGPVHAKWVVQHHDGIPGREFRDRQEHGPFESWEHLHRFEPEGAGGCRMTDRVEFRLPAHNITGALAAETVSHRIERGLRYRHDTLRADLATHENAPAPLRIAITGATGLVGTSLSAFLTTGGHTVLPVTRRDPGPGQVGWAPRHGRIEAGKLEGVDAVV
ncbi:MAG: SRPBCC family protein, partial [Gemmatimonadales bacterium]